MASVIDIRSCSDGITFCNTIDNLTPLTNATVPRLYRRLVGTQWQVYFWQLNRLRTWATGQGGVITSEESSLYLDSGYTVPVLPATRLNPASNPFINTTGALTSNQHFINYNTTSYLNVTTENPVYYRHVLTFEIDNGCGLQEVEARLEEEMNTTGATTAWSFVEPFNDYNFTII